jgi:hypothetical protein
LALGVFQLLVPRLGQSAIPDSAAA